MLDVKVDDDQVGRQRDTPQHVREMGGHPTLNVKLVV
jgi:hypothetical protein